MLDASTTPYYLTLPHMDYDPRQLICEIINNYCQPSYSPHLHLDHKHMCFCVTNQIDNIYQTKYSSFWHHYAMKIANQFNDYFDSLTASKLTEINDVDIRLDRIENGIQIGVDMLVTVVPVTYIAPGLFYQEHSLELVEIAPEQFEDPFEE